MTRCGAKPLIIEGCYVLIFALGMGLFFHLARELENPLRSRRSGSSLSGWPS